MAKILVVEDEAHILRVTAMWLERHGHDVLEAQHGAIALEILEHETVDLIISDLNMPVMDGLDLVRAVRDERRINVPILLLTARCDQDELVRRLQPYGIGLYPKPFAPSRLVADIDRLLKAVPQ